jgi:hypothetical protein
MEWNLVYKNDNTIPLQLQYKTNSMSLYNNIDIFVNCNWVANRWQLYSTHLHTHSTEQHKNKQYTEQHKNKQYIEQVLLVPSVNSRYL